MHQTIESDDELISETVEGADGANASPSGTSLKEQVSEKRRGKETPRFPRIQTEVGALEKELNELQLQCKKMDLLKQIEKCREKIANHQTGGNQATPQSNIQDPPDLALEQPASGHNAGTDQGVTDLLALLNGAASTSTTANILKPRQNKARLVHDYIWDDPLLIHDKDEILTISSAGVKLNRRIDKEYFKISIEQWGYGNARILQEMIEQKEVDSQGIIDYLEYTKNVNRLFSRYVKGSVLLYDHEYRESQHKEKFKWGTPMSNLLDFQLIPKQNSLSAQVLQGQAGTGRNKTNQNRPQRRKDPYNAEGKEICRKFNTNNCDFPNCKLVHCCSVCYATNHNAIEHNQKK